MIDKVRELWNKTIMDVQRILFLFWSREREFHCIQINKLNSKKKKWRKQIKVKYINKQRSFLYDCNKTIFMWLLSSAAALITCVYIYIYISIIFIYMYIYIYIYFQTYIIFSINLVSFKVTLRSSGTDILYGCHLLLDVCIIYFISCDCIMNSSLSYPIY